MMISGVGNRVVPAGTRFGNQDPTQVMMIAVERALDRPTAERLNAGGLSGKNHPTSGKPIAQLTFHNEGGGTLDEAALTKRLEKALPQYAFEVTVAAHRITPS